MEMCQSFFLRMSSIRNSQRQKADLIKFVCMKGTKKMTIEMEYVEFLRLWFMTLGHKYTWESLNLISKTHKN